MERFGAQLQALLVNDPAAFAAVQPVIDARAGTREQQIEATRSTFLGMIELLAHTALDDKQRRMLDTCRDSAQVLLALLNDVLDFSKIEAGKVELESLPLSPGRMIGYLYITDAPYFARTDAHGRVAFDALPAGRYEVRVWQPRLPPGRPDLREQSTTLSANEGRTLAFAVALRPDPRQQFDREHTRY